MRVRSESACLHLASAAWAEQALQSTPAGTMHKLDPHHLDASRCVWGNLVSKKQHRLPLAACPPVGGPTGLLSCQ